MFNSLWPGRQAMTHPTTASLLTFMHAHQACSNATEWVQANAHLSFAELWDLCERGDRMLWLAAAAKLDHKTIVLAACDCAERALRFVPEGEDRPRKAIEVTRAWTRGEATIEQVRAARRAARAARAAWAARAAATAEHKECAALVRGRISAAAILRKVLPE